MLAPARNLLSFLASSSVISLSATEILLVLLCARPYRPLLWWRRRGDVWCFPVHAASTINDDCGEAGGE